MINDLKEFIINGKNAEAVALTEKALKENISPAEILNNGLIAGMDVVGEYFKNNEFYVPQVLMAARAMQQSMDVLKPKLVAEGVEAKGKIVIGTVKGDQHNIGKNLVAMMLEGNGYEVVDLGVNVTPEKFALAVSNGADLLGMSALLTTTMPQMKKVIDLLKEKGLRDKVKVMVGGAPVTEEFAKEIGADGYSQDAAGAVDLAKALLG